MSHAGREGSGPASGPALPWPARQGLAWRTDSTAIVAADPGAPTVLHDGLDDLDRGDLPRKGFVPDHLVAAAFAARMRASSDWAVDPAQVRVLDDLTQALYAVVIAFSDPGDGVILLLPGCPSLREAIETTGRRMIPFEMDCTTEGHVFDLDKAERLVDRRTRILLLCNPQNPTGRVFTRSELESIAEFAERHDLIVVSDEAHSDLIYPGRQHLPFGALSREAVARTVTLNWATKCANVPGPPRAVACFGTAALMRRFHLRVPARMIGAVHGPGIEADADAWAQGQPWLDAVRTHLLTMRDHVAGRLRRELPAVQFHLPQATSLLWLDCSGLDIDGSPFDFLLQHARVGLSPGQAFHPKAAKFIQMNFAYSKPIIDGMLDRMIAAVDDYDYLRRLRTAYFGY